ncbi:hypothetical protein Agabi119p4_4924 [Agaricus bisporus var. burnettii]|uniref:Reverse transcriptase domain-containing protein n=1 Tax=Agaricus bisporus var. burnettii TaxID=192524 RepID=A0A8H7F486_AGABI|nr:hypothetical protein Agabi119p4_4924 [Agaricus bisporus var. burnettii]
MMDHIFAPLIKKGGVLVYMDDILIHAITRDELENITLQVLKILQKNDLFLKPEKCEFAKQRLEYLGAVITPATIEMDTAKLNGIKDWPIPKSTRDVRKFIGFCNFYRRFIK